MRLLLSAIPLLLLMFAASLNARADEIAQRTAIQKAAVTAFIDGHFDELDAMADQFRNGRERTESGVWKLTYLYWGIRRGLLEPKYNAASFDQFEAQALSWISARPKSTTAKLVYADILADHAWFLRGSGYYNQLTDEQRSGYIKYHSKARDNLAVIKDEVSKDPHWYAAMIRVATEEGWSDETFDHLLAEAVEREPYYYETYFVAIDRNLPQWGGSADKINALIARATNYTADFDGSSFMARGYWWTSSHGKDVFDMDSLHATWPDVAKGFQDLVSRYPDQWNFNAYAKFACLAKDRTRFLVAYSFIKVRPIAEAWDYTGQDAACAAWAMHPERNIEVKDRPVP